MVQFSLDEIDNEITLQAFKLLVEDLLALFQAVNEGVINILGMCGLESWLWTSMGCVLTDHVTEHYFAMSKPDARESLDIYKKFAKQTEAVIDYLSMAKRLQRDLEIDIPVGKHVRQPAINISFLLNYTNLSFRRLYLLLQPWKNIFRTLITKLSVSLQSKRNQALTAVKLQQLVQVCRHKLRR